MRKEHKELLIGTGMAMVLDCVLWIGFPHWRMTSGLVGVMPIMVLCFVLIRKGQRERVVEKKDEDSQ